MIAQDEDALICDFAETYHIYDYRALSVKYAAALACGLSEKSRIKKILSGVETDTNTLLLASAVDRLSLLWWAKTKDGQSGKNAPVMLTKLLQGENKQEQSGEGFVSAADFEFAYKEITEGG